MSPSECADNVTVLWWLDDVFWRWPLHIRILSIGLLVSSFFVLQITADQPSVTLIPAIEGDVKVRPADLPKPVWFEEVDDTFLFCSGPCVGLDGEWPKFEVLNPKCSSDSQRYEVGTDPDTPAALALLAMECMLRSPRV